jgi:hypothetical protein
MTNSTTTFSPRRAAVASAALLLPVLLSMTPLLAVTSQTWRLREKEEFEKGEPKGVSLAADGAIRLSPILDTLYETPQPYVWALAQDRRGAVYVAGGNDGEIHRIGPSGKGEFFFRAQEPEVHALAAGDDGYVYAAGSPGGRVYKIAPDGKEQWTCDTGEKYVWALAFDRQGRLFAGTGTEGRVLKIDPSGRSEVFFDSAETHIRSLHVDSEGNLLAGSDGHGLIFRISPRGEGVVLYDAPLNEVAALVPGPQGTIYAAVVGEGTRGTPRGERQAALSGGASPAAPPASEGGQGAQPAPAVQPQAEQGVSLAMEGKVLAVSPDGYGREIWSGSQEAVLSLEMSGDGRLLMGSSHKGRIYMLDPDGTTTEIARVSSSQVTVLQRRAGAGRPGGGREDVSRRRARGAPADDEQERAGRTEVLVGASNEGAVAALRTGFVPSGAYESRVLDARSFAAWGMVSWRADLPKGTAIALNTRSGNTEDPDRTWSAWSPDLGDGQGAPASSPPARFLQWRAVLTTQDPGRTPQLREVAITYLQRNIPPEIRKAEVQAPGVAMQKVPAVQPGQAADAKPGPGGAEAEGGTRHRPRPQSRRYFEAGARSISWQAADPNDDDLFYDVFYRAADETRWKKIRTGIDEDFVTLDSTAMPDGTYVVRVVVSDAPSNPPGQSLTAEKVTERFDVDNTPPRVESIRTEVRSGSVALSFKVADSFSIVRQTAYAVDAGDWVEAAAADGLNDSPTESYSLTIPSLPAGEHSIVIRATDAAGNVGAGKAVVEAP